MRDENNKVVFFPLFLLSGFGRFLHFCLKQVIGECALLLYYSVVMSFSSSSGQVNSTFGTQFVQGTDKKARPVVQKWVHSSVVTVTHKLKVSINPY